MEAPTLAAARDLLEALALDRGDPSEAALLRAVAETVDQLRVKDEGQASVAGVELAKLPSARFSTLLRTRRKEASLSLRQLAQRSKVAPNTIRNIESGRTKASAITAGRLARVTELGLLEFSGPIASPRPNTWLLPGYNRRGMIAELHQILNAAGGRLEQTSLYLDDESAGDFLELSSAANYKERFRALPLEPIAQGITNRLGGMPLELLCLGPGDGRSETELAKEVLRCTPTLDLRILLLDISHTLLTLAFGRARAELPAHVTIEALHGDFRHMVRYPVLDRAAALQRRRCFVMLGFTMANVDSELLFIRDSLSQSRPGDLAIVDFQVAWGDRRDPDALRRADPVLSNGTSELSTRWFSGPLRRYGHGIDRYEVGVELVAEGAIEGSYEIDYYADATRGDAVHRYHLVRIRRYDPNGLLDTFARLGWQTEMCLRYGPGDMAAVALLRRA